MLKILKGLNGYIYDLGVRDGLKIAKEIIESSLNFMEKQLKKRKEKLE